MRTVVPGRPVLANETGLSARSRPDGQTPTSGSEAERPPALSDRRGEAPAGRGRDARPAGPGRRCRVQTGPGRNHRPASRTSAGRPGGTDHAARTTRFGLSFRRQKRRKRVTSRWHHSPHYIKMDGTLNKHFVINH